MPLPDKIMPLSDLDVLDPTTLVNKNNLLLLCTAQTVDIPAQHTANLPYSALLTDINDAINTILAPYMYNISSIPNLIVDISNLNKSITDVNNAMKGISDNINAIFNQIRQIESQIAKLQIEIDACCKNKT